MISVRRVVLDILKPHKPNSLEFAKAIAELGAYTVILTVAEKDDQTETVQVVIEAADIDFESVDRVVANLGASLHSIDEVTVKGRSELND